MLAIDITEIILDIIKIIVFGAIVIIIHIPLSITKLLRTYKERSMLGKIMYDKNDSIEGMIMILDDYFEQLTDSIDTSKDKIKDRVNNICKDYTLINDNYVPIDNEDDMSSEIQEIRTDEGVKIKDISDTISNAKKWIQNLIK